MRHQNASDENVGGLLKDLIDKTQVDLLSDIKKSASPQRRKQRKLTLDFNDRNYFRWKEPLDLLQILWESCSESAEKHAHKGALDSDELVFDTLAHLQPRALLISSEIICLLNCGFADGALARWRSLHEVMVVALFVSKNDRANSMAYRHSTFFTKRRSAVNFNFYASKLKMESISSAEMDELDAACKLPVGLKEVNFKKDWDWAAAALGKPGSTPTFFQLEENVGMDHWRPYYKWACQHVHGNFTDHSKQLGMSEAKGVFMQTGASNSGLAEPIHMTAISLMIVTSTFLMYSKPDLEASILVGLLAKIADEIGRTALLVK